MTLGQEMSATGHERTSRHVRVVSVIPLKADIHQRGLHVRLVPIADMSSRSHLSGDSLDSVNEVGTNRR
jgi:hypothetical protein